MDHVARLLPLVSLHRRFWFEVPQSVQPQVPHHPGQGADRHQHQPGDPPEGAALVPEVRGLLQLQRIERPPLGAAHTPSIRQSRWSA